MKPTVQIAAARTPDGEELTLHRRDDEFSIRVGGQELMTSRASESERELARLGCAGVRARPDARVLVGGLGMGFTLREALDLLRPSAAVVVSELIPAVVEWNREHLGPLAGHPLRDRRVELKVGDVVEALRPAARAYDAILLDVDNGPEAFTSEGNSRLYGGDGLQMCMRALRKGGCLAVWSVAASPAFERRLRQQQLSFRRVPVPAYKGARTLSRSVWLIACDARALPPGRGPAEGTEVKG